MRAERYDASKTAEWNDFVAKAKNGHFMFYRNYMDYHADRFPDSSLMFYDQNDNLAALFPATLRGDTLSSHAGLTVGGVVSSVSLKIDEMLSIFHRIGEQARQFGARSVVYKVVPHIYHKTPAEEDLYALFRMGAKLVRRDISSTIDLRNRVPPSKGRKWAIRQAKKYGVVVTPSHDFRAFMDVEAKLLREKYEAVPTHTAAEIELLASRFPENIRLFTASIDDQLLAGVIIYETENVAHTQYIGSTELGRERQALDAIIHTLIDDIYNHKAYFDFGISTEEGGNILNIGLIDNKQSYGARAVVYDAYQIDL